MRDGRGAQDHQRPQLYLSIFKKKSEGGKNDEMKRWRRGELRRTSGTHGTQFLFSASTYWVRVSGVTPLYPFASTLMRSAISILALSAVRGCPIPARIHMNREKGGEGGGRGKGGIEMRNNKNKKIPAECDRIKFSWSCSSLSCGIITSAKLPNPVFTPYTIFPALTICTDIKEKARE